MQTVLHPSEQIQSAIDLLCRSLGDALIGVYLHGSAVSGGLKGQSDIDLLAVVDAALTDNQRNDLLAGLLRLSGRHPGPPEGPRCLEVMVFCRPDLACGGYPARADFVYGEWLRDRFEAGEIPLPHVDPDHTLVLAQARQQAMSLLGPPRGDLLPEVSPQQVRWAMRDLLPRLLDSLYGDETNVLLTLARMWRTASSGAFVTKDAAADWAMARLSGTGAPTMALARRAYLGEVTVDWKGRHDDALSLSGQLSEKITGAVLTE